MLAAAPEGTVIGLIIEGEIALKRSARRALIREGLISIPTPCPLRRCGVELDQSPKSRITIKICNIEFIQNILCIF